MLYLARCLFIPEFIDAIKRASLDCFTCCIIQIPTFKYDQQANFLSSMQLGYLHWEALRKHTVAFSDSNIGNVGCNFPIVYYNHDRLLS